MTNDPLTDDTQPVKLNDALQRALDKLEVEEKLLIKRRARVTAKLNALIEEHTALTSQQEKIIAKRLDLIRRVEP